MISAYLALENPLILQASHRVWPDMYFDDDADAILRRAHRGGHDGVIVHGIDPYSDMEPRSIYIAFDPEQIKSATDNRGTFDPNDPRISYNRTPSMLLSDMIKKRGSRIYGHPMDDVEAELVKEWLRRKRAGNLP